jgi:alpha-glucosidase
MDTMIYVAELVFLCSSTAAVSFEAFRIAPVLGWIYLVFVALTCTGVLKFRRLPEGIFAVSPLTMFNLFLYLTILLSKITITRSPPGTFTTTDAAMAEFAVPAAADNGASLIPNIYDAQAINAQDVCPGYVASNVQRTAHGLTATLTMAGPACNVYGNDVDTLDLTVEYQSADRLAVNIHPTHLSPSNTSYYILPEYLVPKPAVDADAWQTSFTNDLGFFWSNEPTFSFSVIRLSTGDSLFSTVGTKLVYEDQFIEFASALPENYNLYGLGETIHGLRLGNDFTKVGVQATGGRIDVLTLSRPYTLQMLAILSISIYMAATQPISILAITRSIRPPEAWPW